MISIENMINNPEIPFKNFSFPLSSSLTRKTVMKSLMFDRKKDNVFVYTHYDLVRNTGTSTVILKSMQSGFLSFAYTLFLPWSLIV